VFALTAIAAPTVLAETAVEYCVWLLFVPVARSVLLRGYVSLLHVPTHIAILVVLVLTNVASRVRPQFVEQERVASHLSALFVMFLRLSEIVSWAQLIL